MITEDRLKKLTELGIDIEPEQVLSQLMKATAMFYVWDTPTLELYGKNQFKAYLRSDDPRIKDGSGFINDSPENALADLVIRMAQMKPSDSKWQEAYSHK
ncbi:hypothetical protein IC229_33190 [Spirosoma sp. BT702]|uniref:Uncharacterized protein n=1 Tax=Spirosoma profusum TaxID=2771354 RepID=A0A927AW90_9BACT|nr:hypothetical protein [Spirosoma profusum]MBD2705514.1 hypothetical protein [Spirosoma profusum]